jgi:putative RNA 2'-phosphotransferase
MNNQKQMDKISKFLSFVLRHEPEAVGITLDKEGWTDINLLMHAAAVTTKHINIVFDRQLLALVVENNEKKRFEISSDGLRIRAVQGHSTESVSRTLDEKEPPVMLYHGTAGQFIASIMQEGLKAGKRHHVHLSPSIETAIAVGSRHGKVVVLEINTLDMHNHGYKFYQAENGVWLTDRVPVEFLHVATGRRQEIDTNYANQIYSVPAERKDAE